MTFYICDREDPGCPNRSDPNVCGKLCDRTTDRTHGRFQYGGWGNGGDTMFWTDENGIEYELYPDSERRGGHG